MSVLIVAENRGKYMIVKTLVCISNGQELKKLL